ncbi:MAG TPA: hypothetical protein VGQ25_01900 [Gemmatimonadales bacterium]|jgi:hypothetical protein|nr:hypothetical protein [Gemmatimonadales bacterium]
MATSLSGKDWWHANQARYPNSRDTADLDPEFQARTERFIRSLRAAGATVVINSTRRNAIRAHLMHYSWKVGHGDIDPAEVPRKSGLTIDWDHGDSDQSRAAAMEMVNLFHMAYIASLTSNHISGKAIDMTINWKGILELTQPAPLLYRIESLPRTGNENRELHEVGGDVFQMYKLRSDPPHWSFNGR